MTFTK